MIFDLGEKQKAKVTGIFDFNVITLKFSQIDSRCGFSGALDTRVLTMTLRQAQGDNSLQWTFMRWLLKLLKIKLNNTENIKY